MWCWVPHQGSTCVRYRFFFPSFVFLFWFGFGFGFDFGFGLITVSLYVVLAVLKLYVDQAGTELIELLTLIHICRSRR